MLAPPKPPSVDELELLIREARERQLRRRLLGAAGVAIAAAIGLGIYALMIAGRPGAGASGNPSAAGAPLCRASQLSGSFVPGGAAGNILGGLVLANIGGRACSLPARRPAVHITFRGKPVPTEEGSWGPNEQFGVPAGHTLRPRAKAMVEIGWRDWCPNLTAAPDSRRATLFLRFRGGLRLAVPETPPDRFAAVPGCGEAVHPTPRIAVSGLLRYR
jgi:hypothetical protein